VLRYDVRWCLSWKIPIAGSLVAGCDLPLEKVRYVVSATHCCEEMGARQMIGQLSHTRLAFKISFM
jgi:hypothetical protein